MLVDEERRISSNKVVKWCNFQWLWVTHKLDFKVTVLFNVKNSEIINFCMLFVQIADLVLEIICKFSVKLRRSDFSNFCFLLDQVADLN